LGLSTYIFAAKENLLEKRNGKMRLHNKQVFGTTLVIVLVLWVASIASSHAETLTGEDLKRNPIAAKILENIKKIEKKHEQEKLHEANKLKSHELRQIDLQRLEMDTKPYSPPESFKRFLSKINGSDATKQVFWDQFNFMIQKTQEAKMAKTDVLKNGGTNEQAMKAFADKAKIKRLTLISFNQDANIKAGIADAKIQKMFDKYGKLPRYD